MINISDRNAFNSDIPNLKSRIENGYQEVIQKDSFFSGTENNEYDIHNYKTVFNWILKGVDPLKDAEKSKFHFQYKSVTLISFSYLLTAALIIITLH